jgi:hypothetical protein
VVFVGPLLFVPSPSLCGTAREKKGEGRGERCVTTGEQKHSNTLISLCRCSAVHERGDRHGQWSHTALHPYI